MKGALVIAILTAGLAAGCGSATGAGATSAPDLPVSHDVPAGSQPSHAGPTLVTPLPGADAGAPVEPVGLRTGVSPDGHAWARVTWWGGIPTCYVLRPVVIQRTGRAIGLVLREGSDAPPGTVCAEIAMLKAVRVDLGPLAPGTYIVGAGGRRSTLIV
jgi:hypothetical protein